MLMLLALAGQAMTLDPAPAKAAMACATAVAVAADANASPIQLTAHVTYYAMQAAKAEPGTGPFLERINTLSGELGKSGVPSRDEAQALTPQCDQRFPLARRTNAVLLPADPFRRDVLCLGAIGILVGAAQSLQEDNGDATELNRLKPSMDAYNARLSDSVLKAHGYTTGDAFQTRLGDELKASLAIGNVDQIERACTAALVKA